jgi:transcriptional regulator with PAS, ATPase and Fis domain
VLRFFMNYSWPGNIRELENVIERCSFLTEDNLIRIQDLPQEITGRQTDNSFKFDTNMTLEELEDKYIRYIYDQCGQNKMKASEILGIDRKTVQRRLKPSR